MLFDDTPHSSTPLTLSQLNGLVREVIELSMPDEYWVTAELASIRENNGHCYMELIEKDDYCNTPAAQARACCWRNTWMRLAPRFSHTTGQPLHPGIKVMLRLRASFHEAFGFSWTVTDIDPSYTMGDMARRRQEILKKLREEGVADMNKTLRIPAFAQRIAVISSASAAGYGDFCNQLKHNEYSFTFQTTLFTAIMQGEHVQDSVIKALEDVYDKLELFDVVVIIRGGGSTADLSGFDTLPLAEHVANFPLPVITGIGHERDQSVLDIIACVSQKTPTAVATFLIDNLADTLHTINDCSQRIAHAVNNRIQQQKLKLQESSQRVTAAALLRCTREANMIQQYSARLSHSTDSRLTAERTRIDSAIRRIPLLVTPAIERWRHRLDMLEQRAKAVDPAVILKRGYSITTYKGKAVTDASQLKPGDKVRITLAKGTTDAVVK